MLPVLGPRGASVVCGWVGVGAWVPPGALAGNVMIPFRCSEPGMWEAWSCAWLFFILPDVLGALAGTSGQLFRPGPLALLLMPLSSAGARPLSRAAGEPAWSLPLFEVPSPASFLSSPSGSQSPPPCSPLSLRISQSIPEPKAGCLGSSDPPNLFSIWVSCPPFCLLVLGPHPKVPGRSWVALTLTAGMGGSPAVEGMGVLG